MNEIMSILMRRQMNKTMDILMGRHGGWDKSYLWSPLNKIALWLLVATCAYLIWVVGTLPMELQLTYFGLVVRTVERFVAGDWRDCEGVRMRNAGIIRRDVIDVWLAVRRLR